MQKHISFPSINQFRSVVKNIRSSAEWNGVQNPTVTFEISKKIHGTNFSIVRPIGGNIDDIWVQSRENIITPLKDNAGLAMFVHANKDIFNVLLDKVESLSGEGDTTKFVQVFGEGFGSSIQKGVGVNGLPKSICIFGIRISEDSASSNWMQKDFYDQVFTEEFLKQLNEVHVYTKYQFGVQTIDIDFNRPEDTQNKLVEITEAVEKDCPVARYFKPDAEMGTLIGEGIVCTPIQTDSIGFDVRQHFFKVKGEKHSSTKTKNLASVDTEKLASVDAFVEYALTENRLKQGLSKLEEMGLPKDMTSMGAAIGWVVRDCISEELDTLAASGLVPKDVTGKLSTKARAFYLENLV